MAALGDKRGQSSFKALYHGLFRDFCFVPCLSPGDKFCPRSFSIVGQKIGVKGWKRPLGKGLRHFVPSLLRNCPRGQNCPPDQGDEGTKWRVCLRNTKTLDNVQSLCIFIIHRLRVHNHVLLIHCFLRSFYKSQRHNPDM